MKAGSNLWHIMPALICNYQCSHCCNSSGPQNKALISDQECESLIEDLERHAPRELQFIGGEPTLFIPLINKLINAHPQIDECDVMVVTNGWFATSEERAKKKLSDFSKLTKLQMSYDIFHKSRSKKENVLNLKKACEDLNIKFNISVAVTDLRELLEARTLTDEFQIPAMIGRVEASGRAADNSLEFNYPSYDDSVRNSKCPNRDGVTYIPEKGFSICCSNLIFNNDVKGMYSQSIDKLYENQWFNTLATMTMREIASKFGLDLPKEPRFSSTCATCEYLFTNCKGGPGE